LKSGLFDQDFSGVGHNPTKFKLNPFLVIEGSDLIEVSAKAIN
jgi:hypothetical protein